METGQHKLMGMENFADTAVDMDADVHERRLSFSLSGQRQLGEFLKH